MIKIECTEDQAKDLAMIMDAALRATGLQLVRQVHYWAAIVDKAIDSAKEQPKELPK